jgi:hypothetical protein
MANELTLTRFTADTRTMPKTGIEFRKLTAAEFSWRCSNGN